MAGSMLPASVYGLRVPAGGIPIPGNAQFPATFRITMAAIDPSAEPQTEEPSQPIRSTLKLIKERISGDDDSEDEDDEDYDEDDIEAIKARLAGVISDEDEDMSDDEDDSEDEKNGGPSDPAKAKQAKKEAMTKKLQAELDEMELDGLTNGINGKGKGKASGESDSEDDLEIDDSDDEDEVEELVLCTLDPEQKYQQPLDITVGEHELVYFVASGTHDIYITGNYVLPPDFEDDEDDYDEDEMDYDLSPDEDELDDVSESEEDELDGLADPRVAEVDSEEEAPKLVAAEKKGKNKRPAETEVDVSLDDLISKATKADAEEKLSKKQAKKLKKNDGQAAAVEEPAKKDQKDDKKKVQFAKNLEQGPTGSPKVEEPKKEAAKTGPRTVQGVIIDDKKLGKGKAAKKGDKVEMRYIGKLKSNGKQFDANKKGKPFAFKLGVGEVIKGWDVGVAGMTAGGERRLTIPANLAYGKRGAPPDIPGNADLVFDIKCIAIH